MSITVRMRVGPSPVQLVLGVVFHAKAIERSLAYSILAVMVFVHLLEAKFMRICLAIKKASTPDELSEMCAFVMESFGVALICGDTKEEDLTIEWLAGSKTEVGFCQTQITKNKKTIATIRTQATSTTGASTEAAIKSAAPEHSVRVGRSSLWRFGVEEAGIWRFGDEEAA